jgi:hypothetical protein
LPSTPPPAEDRKIIEPGRAWDIAEPLMLEGDGHDAMPGGIELAYEPQIAIRELAQVEEAALACAGALNAMASSATTTATRIVVF